MALNEIYNIDCIEGIRQLEDKSIDCIVTDPPYFLGMTHNGQKGCFEDLAICKPFFTTLAKEFNRVLKDGGTMYFFTDWRGYAFYYPIMAESLPVRNMLVWDKVSGTGNFYGYCHELIIYASKKRNQGGSNVLKGIKSLAHGAKKTNGEKVHPTQKTIELISKFVTDGSDINGVVLDCFMGSGTTAIACMRNKRNFIGFEIGEKYFNISHDRIKKEKETSKQHTQ